MFTFTIQKGDYTIQPNTIEVNSYRFYHKDKLLFELEETISQKNTRKNIELLDKIIEYFSNYVMGVQNKQLIFTLNDQNKFLKGFQKCALDTEIKLTVQTIKNYIESKEDEKKYFCDSCQKKLHIN